MRVFEDKILLPLFNMVSFSGFQCFHIWIFWGVYFSGEKTFEHVEKGKPSTLSLFPRTRGRNRECSLCLGDAHRIFHETPWLNLSRRISYWKLRDFKAIVISCFQDGFLVDTLPKTNAQLPKGGEFARGYDKPIHRSCAINVFLKSGTWWGPIHLLKWLLQIG